MSSESELERRIILCVDAGLQVLGNGGKRVIYYYLEKNFMLKREDIPKKPKKFLKGLDLMFGEQGKDLIEKWIVEKLKITFNLKQQSKITFTKAVEMIKTHAK